MRSLLGALLLGVGLAVGGCGDGDQSTATTTVITASSTYRYPPSVIDSFMRSCTRGKPARESLCACVIDKLSHSVSIRDFARIERERRAVPRVARAFRQATTACAEKS